MDKYPLDSTQAADSELQHAMPPEQDLWSEERQRESGRYTRRLILKGIGYAAATTAGVAMGVTARAAEEAAYFPETLRLLRPEIHMYEGLHDEKFPESYVFMIPGFNCDYQEELGEALSFPGNTFARVGRIEMSSTGIDIAELAATIHDHILGDRVDTDMHSRKNVGHPEVSLYGHSTGGLVALQLAAELKSRYGIKVPQLFMDCTPDGVASVKRGQAALQRLAGVSDVVLKNGGKALRFLSEMFGSKENDNTWADCINIGERKITESDVMAMPLLKAQAGEICGEKWRGIINKLQGVDIVYFRPDVAANDHTVYVERASRNFRSVFPQLQVCMIPGGTHAAINDRRPAYCQAIIGVAKDNPELQAVDSFYQESKRKMMADRFESV
jgi:hypothetical protein